jgi:putative membrane protein
MVRAAANSVALCLLCPSIVWADGQRIEPASAWHAWNLDPLVVLSLGLVAWFYRCGLMRLWARVGRDQKVHRWQAACFAAGLSVAFVALLSPLDVLSGQLSSAHMVQHMLLITVAAPLLVLGSPTLVLAWGLLPGDERLGRSALRFLFRLPQDGLLWQPLLVWTLFAALLWSWHHPTLYQAALADPLVHDAQHLSFLAIACLFWRLCLDPLSVRRLSAPAAIPYLFATSAHSAALGIFLALSPGPWYFAYADRTIAGGLTPLEDQQLAGLIMWMPACLIFPAASATLFASWLAGLPHVKRYRRRNMPGD